MTNESMILETYVDLVGQLLKSVPKAYPGTRQRVDRCLELGRQVREIAERMITVEDLDDGR